MNKPTDKQIVRQINYGVRNYAAIRDYIARTSRSKRFKMPPQVLSALYARLGELNADVKELTDYNISELLGD